MEFQAQRRQFFRHLSGRKSSNIRPPWSIVEENFIEKCTGCNACVTSCPQHIIALDSHGFASIKFSQGYCDFCALCVKQCETGALSQQVSPIWLLKAKISNLCIEFTGTYCHICQDQCEQEAISFKPQTGGIYSPVLQQAQCNGCGACVENCPSLAIEMFQLPQQESVQ
ncbi:MAG: ferredoxin-type protein NapF [Gammaproteobacteria bacterium CG22_combo_CG10-13_8_21_14_all_40_8]|nr:MAG: ferredoxin-type protein NapF [Gammaproteobacteria bacterium CG22_combo_CG10-13_8_21_14_all_40_8]